MIRNLFLIPLLVAFAASCEVPSASVPPDLTLVHLNDTYRIGAVEDGTRGGFARVATIVRGLERDGHDVRIVHAGDFLFPSLESQLWAGEQMVEALNYLDDLAPLYLVPGNHEFDPRTADALIAAVRASHFHWLADNVSFDTGAADVDAAFHKGFTFAAGDRTIGVFALTLNEEDGGNARSYARIDGDYVDRARDAIESLEAQGVDLIFGLTHLPIAVDRRIARLRAQHPSFRFIVGGHEHEPEFDEGTPASAIIMKGASNARSIWQIDIRFGDTPENATIETTVLNVDETIPGDPAYQVIADKWRQRLLATAPFLPAKIGEAALPLDGREVALRNDESNWGDFIADQMRGAFGQPPADLAFLNSGTLRIDDYVAEDITFEDIGRTFGFSSFLRYMTLAGRDFRAVLEAGFRGNGPSKGYFPQVSGFRVCVDRGHPDGQRIVQLLVPAADGWHEIEADRDYLVVAPDFIYRGGDGYDFSRARDVSRPGSELQYLVLDAILEAQARGEKVGAAVTPDSRRIAFLEAGKERCFD